MFRALSLLTLASAALAAVSIPDTVLLSRELSARHDSDCAVCLQLSSALQNCTTASACCGTQNIVQAVQCASCVVETGTTNKGVAQSLLGQYTQACKALGVDVGSLSVNTSSGAQSATPSVSASTAEGATTLTAPAPVFTGADVLSSLAASASQAFTSFSAESTSSASAAASSAAEQSSSSSIAASASSVGASASASAASVASSASQAAASATAAGNSGSGAAGLSAPASLVVAAVGAAAVFLA